VRRPPAVPSPPRSAPGRSPLPLSRNRSAERAARAHLLADRGNPIKLASKPLRVVVRDSKASDEPDAWVAESGFFVRRVGLESGKTKQLYRGHGGPVTSLAFHSSNGRELLVSGSWDKSFRVWDTQVRRSAFCLLSQGAAQS